MYETEAWEEVRARNGWVNIHNSGDEVHGLSRENQEKVIKELMIELGFLESSRRTICMNRRRGDVSSPPSTAVFCLPEL